MIRCVGLEYFQGSFAKRRGGIRLKKISAAIQGMHGLAFAAVAAQMRYDDVSALYAAVGEGHVSTQSVIEKEFALSGSEQNPDLTGKSVREPFAFFVAVMLFYLLLTWASTTIFETLERRYARGFANAR